MATISSPTTFSSVQFDSETKVSHGASGRGQEGCFDLGFGHGDARAHACEHVISHNFIRVLVTTFPIVYDICMEEHTCDLKLPHTNRKCGRKGE